jgi:nucleoside-diphosphate-sugar epimerase
MSRSYQNFAIVGAGGYIGTFVLNAFVAAGYKPLIVSRKSSSYSPPASLSAPFAKADLENVDEVASALQEHRIEVLVSLVGTGGIDSQRTLADAAKKGGVKLFVPSEFGFVSEGISKDPREDQTTPQAEKDRFIGMLFCFLSMS